MNIHNNQVNPSAPPQTDLSISPLLVIWETTQACGLACQHCRADARDWHSPDELTTQQAKDLLDSVKELGTRVFVLSGGDPMRRSDLLELIEYGTDIGLRMCTIPAAVKTLSKDALKALKDAGLAKVAFSLDLPFAAGHDDMRQIPGTFDITIQAAQWAREIDLSMQINSLVCKESAPHLTDMGHLVEELGADMWELMFLIPVGRGLMLNPLTAEECESAFAKIWEIEKSAPFIVKVTEAPHYRRFLIENGHRGRIHRVNSAKGFAFVSHHGDVYPSGFLPFSAGNVKTDNLTDIYRSSELFVNLRNSEMLDEPCGTCAAADICGGSRSRAFAVHGSPFAAEPWCVGVKDPELIKEAKVEIASLASGMMPVHGDTLHVL